MKLIQIRQEKGITTADLAIAIIILIIFVSLISTAFYNYYISSAGKNRSAIATNCAIDVIEQVKKMEYDQITQETVEQLVDKMKTIGIEVSTGNTIYIPEPYRVTVNLKNYHQTEGNTDKKDVIKQVTVTIQYEVSKKTEQIQISRLITK